jgi:hypothetical protein
LPKSRFAQPPIQNNVIHPYPDLIQLPKTKRKNRERIPLFSAPASLGEVAGVKPSVVGSRRRSHRLYEDCVVYHRVDRNRLSYDYFQRFTAAKV